MRQPDQILQHAPRRFTRTFVCNQRSEGESYSRSDEARREAGPTAALPQLPGRGRRAAAAARWPVEGGALRPEQRIVLDRNLVFAKRLGVYPRQLLHFPDCSPRTR